MTMRHAPLALLAFLFGGCSVKDASREESGGADWEPSPRNLGKGRDPQVLVRASEAVLFAHAAPSPEGGYDLLFATSHDQGDTFSRPVRVNPTPGEASAHGENGPQLRLGRSQEILLAWEGRGDILLSRSVDFGRSFSAPLRVNDDAGDAVQTFFALEVGPDGAVYAAWIDFRDRGQDPPGTASVYVARSADGGASFGRNVKVAGGVCPCCRPALAFGRGGELILAWRHVYEGQARDPAFSISRDGGEHWTAPAPVARDGWALNGCPHSGPALAPVGGRILAAWYTGVGNRARLRIAALGEDGSGFGPAEDVQGPVQDANHPHLLAAAGEAWLIFQGREEDAGGEWGRTRVWARRVRGAGGVGELRKLPFAGGSVSYPRLAGGTAGRLYASWTESDPEGSRVFLLRGRLRE
jgi:hypothetical protein